MDSVYQEPCFSLLEWDVIYKQNEKARMTHVIID